ncbi:MAG: guanylate kinase [Pseudomonadota bacterium]|nr:guanylate kinase [Pseudomonadota bacterium]
MSGQQTSDRRGRMIILSAPSGSGKTTIARAMAERHTQLAISVSHTTRAPRDTEREGRDYFFVDRHRFLEMVANGEFLEHAEVFNHLYGTSRSAVEQHRNAGISVILVIDWRGARSVRQQVHDAVSVFIVPPSFAALKRRLTVRGQDSDVAVRMRLREALEEINHHGEYDHLVVNDCFETALGECEGLIFSGIAPTSGNYFDADSFMRSAKNGTLASNDNSD